jgi:hypothetical protein
VRGTARQQGIESAGHDDLLSITQQRCLRPAKRVTKQQTCLELRIVDPLCPQCYDTAT